MKHRKLILDSLDSCDARATGQRVFRRNNKENFETNVFGEFTPPKTNMTIENQTFVTFEDVFPIEHRGFSNVMLVNSGVGHDLRNFQCLFLLVFIWAISEVTLPLGHHSHPLCLYQYG